MNRWVIALAAAGVVAALAVVIASNWVWRDAKPDGPRAGTDWPAANGDEASTRAVAGSIAGDSRSLQTRFRFRIPGEPGFSGIAASTPIAVGDRIYLQDLNSNVYALTRADGHLLWKHRYNRPDGGPNGVAVADGLVVGNTNTTAFALDARTGDERWHTKLTTSRNPITIAPAVSGGLVYTSSTGQAPGGRGVLYALDAKSGAVRWRFDTIVGPWRYPKEASGGGAWYPPSFDGKGRVYWGTSNPYPWGGSRLRPNGGMYPGDVRHTDSLVVLDTRSGRRVWADQVTPHDVRDYDFQLSPVLADNLVIGAGKAGRVIAWDRDSHERVWEAHVGLHQNDTGPLPRKPVRVCPGLLGGAETPMAYASGRVFVPVVDLCFPESAYGTSGFDFFNTDYSKGTGELVALDSATGRRLWTRRFPSPDFGCATVVGDIVFTATYDGRIYGLSTSDGEILYRARTRAGINACPAVAGDLLLVAAGADHPAFPSPAFELVAYELPQS